MTFKLKLRKSTGYNYIIVTSSLSCIASEIIPLLRDCLWFWEVLQLAYDCWFHRPRTFTH